MDDLFKPVKTTRKVQSHIEKFETLSLSEPRVSQPATNKPKISILDLSPEEGDVESETFNLRPSVDSSASHKATQPIHKLHKRHDSTAFLDKTYLEKNAPRSLPDDAREILKSQPDREDLFAVLQYLQYGIEGRHDFNIHVPGPKASQIINVLVTVTIPDQWLHLRGTNHSQEDKRLKAILLSSLTSVAGIGALLMQARRLSSTSTDNDNPLLEDAVTILSTILNGSKMLSEFLSDSMKLFTVETQRRVFWQETTALFAGSKIFTTMAQILATHRSLDSQGARVAWLGDGPEYSKWLARNISAAATSLPTPNTSGDAQFSMLCQVLKRGLSLGYRDTLIAELYSSLLLGKRALWTTMHILVESLPGYDQKSLFDSMLRDLARKFLQTGANIMREKDFLERNATPVGGVAAMISGLVQNNSLLQNHIIHWLTATNGEYGGLGLDARRAVIATLASRQEKLQQILEKCLGHFGDKLQIQHDSILQQEATAQTILLAAGHLNRLNHESLKQISSSGTFLRMVSNRLSASLPRARFLGMLVGVAISRLVDKPDKAMNFGVEEMEGDEAQRWMALVHLTDTVGDLDDLQKATGMSDEATTSPQTSKTIRKKRVPASQPQTSKIIAIEELSDSDNAAEEDPDLRPYARPDSDPEDSEDDPTLINRNKPSPPVYISSLIKQLNSSDDPSTVELALKTAPSLIRRKANFGDELSSNVIQLCSSLLNLQDGMSNPDMQQLRLDALIASLVSTPELVGPWIGSMYLEGDFSISQRAVLLTAIGLGAREIAGMDDDMEQPTVTEKRGDPSFPSRRLPPQLESIYTSPESPINALSTSLSHRTLQPMALEAAEKITGPNILKVRTFSSRMAVAAKTAAKREARSKRIPKDLHKLLSEAIYLPLCSRMTLFLSAVSTAPYLANSTLLHPSMLKLHLQTLIVLLSTIGPNALQLPTLTRETLLLLTALHTLPALAHDPVVLPAMLHLLLTMLDLNVEAGSTSEERLVTDFGPMIAELVSWATSLGDRVSIPEVDSDPGLGMALPWPVLVAGIQVKWQEVGRKFQGRMLGLMAGTDFDSF